MTTECHDQKNCVEMLDKLSEFLDDELDEMACEIIEHHASECMACKVCLETLKRTIELCRRIDTRPVPESFSARLKQSLEEWSPADPPPALPL